MSKAKILSVNLTADQYLAMRGNGSPQPDIYAWERYWVNQGANIRWVNLPKRGYQVDATLEIMKALQRVATRRGSESKAARNAAAEITKVLGEQA